MAPTVPLNPVPRSITEFFKLVLLKIAISVFPGTPALQLAAVLQLLSAPPPVQVIFAAEE
jgi:hypothetical protein